MQMHAILIDQLRKLAQMDAAELDSLFALLPKRAPEIWRRLVIGAYLDDQINLGKAAELLDKHPFVLRQELQKVGIPVKLGVESVDEIESDAATLRKLRNDGRG